VNPIFAPAGPAAHTLAQLGWLVLGVFTLISVLMWALLLLVIRRPQGTLAEHAPWNARGDLTWVSLGGFIGPSLILGVIFVISLVTMSAVPASGAHGPEEMTNGMHQSMSPAIQVIGHQFWWEVRYPANGADQEIVTANEIHLPVGRMVEIQLISRDVIHSFWVPQLHGKVDLIPGVDNRIRLQADNPGLYHGACAEFCGRQHAHMLLLVSADADADFDAWKAQQRAAAPPPQMPEAVLGQQMFMKHECAICHAIRGTEAKSQVGPDLTHVAGRRGIAANAFWNNTGNLEAWVTHAQSLKPGSAMPDVTAFNGDELRALVAYLQSLR
jgi:cytochrome c oxidase subunit 2